MHTIVTDYGRSIEEITDAEWEALEARWGKRTHALNDWERIAVRQNTALYHMRTDEQVKQDYSEASRLRCAIANRLTECRLRQCKSPRT